MSKVHQITPFLHVPDLERAIPFFESLGFELKFRVSDYAYLELGGCGIRVLEEQGRAIEREGRARVSVYIDVSDVDALVQTLRPVLELLPQGAFEPVQDQPWHQREFQVRLPDGDWLTFGQPRK
jgi:catechol 2,3-dioxygenase-like lactoylglutathione lyase family enzyme